MPNIARSFHQLDREHGSSRRSYIWLNVALNAAERTDLIPGPDPLGLVADNELYPTTGTSPGVLEAPLSEKPGAKREKRFQGTRVPTKSKFVNYEPVVEGAMLWTGDVRVLSFFRPPGPKMNFGLKWGGESEPDYWTLLVLHYDDYRPGIVECHLYWRVSIDPIDFISGSPPDKFPFTAHPHVGLITVEGKLCPRPKGSQICNEWRQNLNNELVDPDGKAIGSASPDAFGALNMAGMM